VTSARLSECGQVPAKGREGFSHYGYSTPPFPLLMPPHPLEATPHSLPIWCSTVLDIKKDVRHSVFSPLCMWSGSDRWSASRHLHHDAQRPPFLRPPFCPFRRVFWASSPRSFHARILRVGMEEASRLRPSSYLKLRIGPKSGNLGFRAMLVRRQL